MFSNEEIALPDLRESENAEEETHEGQMTPVSDEL